MAATAQSSPFLLYELDLPPDSFCSAISSITLFTCLRRSNRRRRRTERRRRRGNNKTSTVIWALSCLPDGRTVDHHGPNLLYLKLQLPISNRATLHKCIAPLSGTRFKFLFRLTHCAKVGLFATRKNDKEQKGMDLIKEKRSLERQIDRSTMTSPFETADTRNQMSDNESVTVVCLTM